MTGLQDAEYVEGLLMSSGRATALHSRHLQRSTKQQAWAQSSSYGGRWCLNKFRTTTRHSNWSNLDTDELTSFRQLAQHVVQHAKLLCSAVRAALDCSSGMPLSYRSTLELLSSPEHKIHDVSKSPLTFVTTIDR